MIEETVFLSVLIIDDSHAKETKIREALQSKGDQLNVHLARDQKEAIKQLQTEKHDLVILDMLLPTIWGETEPEKSGGENILSDLFTFSDDYKMPTSIVALTEFKDLKDRIQFEYPEVAAIVYSPNSLQWVSALGRKIDSLIKSKQDDSKRVIYCEGKNSVLLNKCGLKNIEFRGLEDCRAIFLAAKNEPNKYALRDKDFLTTKEVWKLEAEFVNYRILKYYCFENYLYHPDNIESIFPAFNKGDYVKEITEQKNDKLFNIIQDYKLSRDSYLELNENGKKRKERKPELEIVSALKSDDFETFYPYFDMAGKKDSTGSKSFNKAILDELNLDKEGLVGTLWFKREFETLLNVRF